MRGFGFILAALLLSWEASAASIFKCVDEAGRVTFTKNQNCPRNSGLADVVSAHNAAPSGSSEAVRMAAPVARNAPAKKRELVVVGEQPVVTVAPAAEPAPRSGVARAAGPAQPCIKIVERRVNRSTITKDGNRRGSSQIIKAPVAC